MNKSRGHTYRLDESLSLVAYRARWTQRGLTARISILTQDVDHGESEDLLGEVCISSLSERATLARALEDLTTATDRNWHVDLVKFFAGIVRQESKASRPVNLQTVEIPDADLSVDIDGWSILSEHPTILFGDGESAKSMLALWVAGKLVQEGRRVLVLDWELSAVDHRRRLELLFPKSNLPEIFYLQCSAPLTELVEQVQKFCEEEMIDFLILDSIAFACGGQAETSEAATTFFAALRDIGVAGSLGIAHQTKISKKADRGREKPFGSVFWHNGARATWLIRAVERDDHHINAIVSCRKSNLEARADDLEVSFTFTKKEIVLKIQQTKETIRSRIISAVKDAGSTGITKKELFAALTNDSADSISRTLLRLQPKVIILKDRRLYLAKTS